MSETVTTILEVGNVIRFVTPVRKLHIHGTITGIVRPRGIPMLTVRRRCDGKPMTVALDQVQKVCRAGTPTVEAVPHVEAPVSEPVVIVEAPARVRPVVSAAAADAEIGDKVRYRSPFGCMKVGVVVEIDESAALIEVGRPSTLECIDLGDIDTVLEAA